MKSRRNILLRCLYGWTKDDNTLSNMTFLADCDKFWATLRNINKMLRARLYNIKSKIWFLTIISNFPICFFENFYLYKLSFIDFKTSCTKRDRLWVKEGGKTKLMKHCGNKEIPDFISRGGRVSVGIDFGPGSQALISYQAVKPRELKLNNILNYIFFTIFL